jgi:hypothetical protein
LPCNPGEQVIQRRMMCEVVHLVSRHAKCAVAGVCIQQTN